MSARLDARGLILSSSTTARSPAGTRPSTRPASTPSTRSSSRGHTRGPASTKPSSPAPGASAATRSPSSWASSASSAGPSGGPPPHGSSPRSSARPASGCRCWPPRLGGTRMQEGTPAFVRWSRSPRRWSPHKAAGLPYLVYLRHPTTGGVFASWGSLGHVTVAEPGALIGFLGPRVFEALYGTPFPAGVQLAENLVDKGISTRSWRPRIWRGWPAASCGCSGPTAPCRRPVGDGPAAARRRRGGRRPRGSRCC